MTEVAFGEYNFRLEEREGKKFIFDIARKKWISLTPEEWVRQHVLQYLTASLHYPLSHLAVERAITLNCLQKRCDVIVFSNSGEPVMIVECKAPEEQLTEKVFEQIARYNLSLKVKYLWVTNGQRNYCCKLVNGIELLQAVPAYSQLNT
jgi:Type I restriction enzyme R protein N terminus (HSDR_N)